MKYLPCDELAANLRDAEEAHYCRLDIVLAEHLIERVAKQYPRRRSLRFEELLEEALDFEVVTDEDERHAYKMALGFFFGNRAQEAAAKKREMNEIPFAPR